MSTYKNILLAIDFSDEAEQVVKKALNIAEINGSEMTSCNLVKRSTTVT